MSTEELSQALQRALAMPPREKFSKLKAIGFQAINEYKAAQNITVGDLKKYMEILRATIQMPSPPATYNKELAKMTSVYVQLLGCENPKIILKKSTYVVLESGTIAIGDRSFENNLEDIKGGEKQYIDLINCGKSFFFGTEGDGDFNVQIRIVEAPEPVLTVKEYKSVSKAGPQVILACPSGQLAVDDGMVVRGIDPQIVVDIEPGNYKCQVYKFNFRGYLFSYYIVLAKTEEPALNHERELLSLQ